ncbi:uncharacterized protein LOC124278040 [Haliotis rubra]|uniref:uncharacterized protein LOC124278040 n=1 Tax=Haliotis rubra TaxID=36100 RepID=UPI001EE5226A|nr:uncharacterized protein LOC124278040 [Haliotis rubra]
MLRIIILASCAVAGISAACSEGYNETVIPRCFRAKQNMFGDYVLYVPCPSGYTRVQNPSLCYKISAPADKKNYPDAMEECSKVQNGRLIDLDSPDKYGFLSGVMTALTPTSPRSRFRNFGVWIGLRRVTSTGFRWNSGSMFVTNWGYKEPELTSLSRCGMIHFEGLANQRCTPKLRYACEVPM